MDRPIVQPRSLASTRWGLEPDAGCVLWGTTHLATGDGRWLLSKKAVLHKESLPRPPSLQEAHLGLSPSVHWPAGLPNGLSQLARELGLCLQTRSEVPLKKEEVNLKFTPQCPAISSCHV